MTMPPPIRTALVTVAESSPFALYGMVEVLGSVGVAWTQLTGEAAASPRFALQLAGVDTAPFTCASGVTLQAQARLAEIEAVEIVIVPDLAIDPTADPRGRWPEAVACLRRLYDAGATLASVCSGSVMLAETGLLDDREATTHWAYRATFERFYPAVRLKPERILTACGPEQRLVTAGGAAAWEDLVLWLIARRCGEEEAGRTARIFLFGDRTDGQLPFAALVPRPAHDDRVVADAQAWAGEHYDEPQAVTTMIAGSGLSERTFHRRFKRATGYAPLQYLQVVRIEEAKQLLERSALATDAVAHEVGYEDPSHFRALFKKLVGVTPARYRQRFCRSGARAELPGEGDGPTPQ